MGKTSKFSFPLPGRKHSSREKETKAKPLSIPTQHVSKAQRLLGAENNLNIDSPIQDQYNFTRPPQSPRNTEHSRMSIAISESTTEDEAPHDVQSEQWDKESGVFPRHQHLYGKASSTILGRGHRRGEYVAATASTTSGGRLRHEDSDSTLKYEHYDRQKSPLAVSQQTSESSARDLALRKGLPPVAAQRSPLLQVDFADPQQQHYERPSSKSNGHSTHSREQADYTHDKEHRAKKPLKLDLSMLNPMGRRRQSKASDVESMASSQYTLSRTSSRATQDSTRRKLTKARSKESLQSKHSVRSPSRSVGPQRSSALTTGTLFQLYDHYEQLPAKSPRMDRIPESRVPERDVPKAQGVKSYQDEPPRPRTGPAAPTSPVINEPFSWQNVRRMSEAARTADRDAARNQAINAYLNNEPLSRQRKGSDTMLSPGSATSEPFSWKNVRSSMVSRNEASSAASVSSRNTKTSRHTNNSGISGSDLKVSSVLSLSSDSESDRDVIISPAPSTTSKVSKAPSLKVDTKQHHAKGHSRQRSNESGGLTPRSHSSRNGSSLKSSTGQRRPIHSIPETSTIDAHSIHRNAKNEPPRTNNQRKPSRQSSRREEKKDSWKEPIVTETPLQPTPPLSPIGPDSREGSIRSNRIMTVTKQEAALLEAMRKKKARNAELERLAKDRESTKSAAPPGKGKSKNRISEASTASTIRAGEREQILLYLETPIEDARHIDKAEPSPDLSDFLTFGSDDDSTPRSSWAPPKQTHARTSSHALPKSRSSNTNSKASPVTPPSAARLSAVGAPGFVVNVPEPTKKTSKGTGVRFVDDAHGKDFLLDDTDAEAVW